MTLQEEAYLMQQTGLTVNVIATKLGISRNAVAGHLYRYRRKHGLKALRSPITQNRVVKPRKLRVIKDREKPSLTADLSRIGDTCRFIYGDVKLGTATLCGHERVGPNYCVYHHQLCHRKA